MNKKLIDKESVIKLVLVLFALSSLLFLFVIFAFILSEGLPLFYKAGVRNIVLGMKWAPTKAFFGIFPMIISSFMVTARRPCRGSASRPRVRHLSFRIRG